MRQGTIRGITIPPAIELDVASRDWGCGPGAGAAAGDEALHFLPRRPGAGAGATAEATGGCCPLLTAACPKKGPKGSGRGCRLAIDVLLFGAADKRKEVAGRFFCTPQVGARDARDRCWEQADWEHLKGGK